MSIRNRAAHDPVLRLSIALLAATGLAAQRDATLGSAAPRGFTAVPAPTPFALFSASDGVHGVELWRTDGTGARTVLVKDLNLAGRGGRQGSYPDRFTVVSSNPPRVYFTARTPATGRELWFTDGTAAGTRRVADLRAGAVGSDPAEPTVLRSSLVFTANDGAKGRELWIATGPNRAVLLKDIDPAGSSSPYGLTVLATSSSGPRLIFAATRAGDTELWVSDGTTPGTKRLKDIHPTASSTPRGMTAFAGRVWFAADSPGRGRELWSTDGTPGGTRLAAELIRGARGSDPAQFTPAGSRLAFTADTVGNGRQLWTLSSGGSLRRMSSFRRGYTIAGVTAGSVFTPPEIWFTVDANVPMGSANAIGVELWRTSGSTVRNVADVRAGAKSSWPSNLYAARDPAGNRMLFRCHDGVSGLEPWQSFGTPASTRRIANLRKDTTAAHPEHSWTSRPMALGRRFLMRAKREGAGLETFALRLAPLGFSLVRDIDARQPLPEQHLRPRASLRVELTDAPPSRPAATLVALAQPANPLPVALVRGAIMLDLTKSFAILSLGSTDAFGNATAVVPILKPFFAPPVPLAWQTFVLAGTDGDPIVASGNGSCTAGGCTRSGGGISSTVTAEGCVDDDTGEYQIEAIRTDGGSNTAYLALVRVKPSGELLLLDPDQTAKGDPICTVPPGATIHLMGTVDFFLPVMAGPDGDPFNQSDKLELRLYLSPPSQATLSTGCVVWRSYC